MRKELFTLETIERFFLFLLMIGLCTLSVVFYKERILFNDTLKCLYDLFYKDALNVTTNRYISIFGELLPFLAFKGGGSLKSVLLLYSLNLILLPVVLSLISMYWFRETRTAWTILLYYVLMSARLFYYPISELQAGLGFLLFYTGFWDFAMRQPAPVRPLTFWCASLFFIPTIIFSHPLALLVFFGWIVLRLALAPRQWQPLAGISLLAIAAQTVKMLFFSVAHDADKAQGITAFRQFGQTYFDTRLTQGFFKALRDDYFLLPFLLVLGVAALFYRRQQLAATLLLLLTLGFWLLVTVSLKDEWYWYYSEHMYQPMILFLALGAGRYFTVVCKRRYYLPVLALVALFSVNKIYYGHEPMTRRLQWYQSCFDLMATKGITKGIVGADHLDIGWDMRANWLSQYESAFLNALQHPAGPTRTVTILWNEADARPLIAQGNALVGIMLNLEPVTMLPQQYFHFNSSHYAILTDAFTEEQVRKLSYESPEKQ